MRKIITLFATMIICLVACSPESKITGSWEGESITVKAAGTSLDINLIEKNISVILTFDNKGTVTMVTKQNGMTETEAEPYSITDDTLTIGDVTTSYSLKGNTLIISGKGDLVEIDGEVSMRFKKI